MRKQEQQQKQTLAAAFTLLLMGFAATASLEAAAKSSKAHRVHRHTQHQANPAVRQGVASFSTGLPNRAAVSPGAAAGPLRFTPQQWQDYGEWMRKSSASMDLVKLGDTEAQLGNWSRAAASYQEALDLWSSNPEGLYGMGQCAAATGDLPRAISYYHTAVYVPVPNTLNIYGTVPGDGFQTNDDRRLMEFALLLNRAGQAQEAVFIYNRAADLMDYERGDVQHGDPDLKVLLPELTTEPAQGNEVPYTPQRLQALADTAIAYKQGGFWSAQKVVAQTREADKLYPDSPVIQYYLGEALAGTYYHTVEHPAQDKAAMTAAYKRAIELGDDKTVAAAKERLSMYP